MLKTERERKLAEIRRILNNAYPLGYRTSAVQAVKLTATPYQIEAPPGRRKGAQPSRAR